MENIKRERERPGHEIQCFVVTDFNVTVTAQNVQPEQNKIEERCSDFPSNKSSKMSKLFEIFGFSTFF